MNLGQLEQEFSALDALPDVLYAVIITHTHGNLLTRAQGIMQWRKALLAGQLPEMAALCWPEETLRKTILMRIETLEIPSFCQGQESLTDSVLKDICAGISSAEDYLAKTANKFNDKLAQRQKIKEKDSSFRDEEGIADHVESRDPSVPSKTTEPPNSNKQKSRSSPTQHEKPTASRETSSGLSGQSSSRRGSPEPSTFNQAPNQTSNQTSNHGAPKQSTSSKSTSNQSKAGQNLAHQNNAGEAVIDNLQQRWQNLAENWQALDEVDRQIDQQANAQLGHKKHNTALTATSSSRSQTQDKGKKLPGRGWDLSTGLLSSHGWRDIIRYRQRIKDLPELSHFIAAIGRDKKYYGNKTSDKVDNSQQNKTPTQKKHSESSYAKDIPRKALEMDGIEHGDDINRMLPAELALLCHPILKTLWHAKRAERLLLLYQHQGKQGQGKKKLGAKKTTGLPSKQGIKGKSDLGRGPIIVCLDTSGSMQGEPEHIAKAIVLEALQVAHREQRRCYLFAFSGPEQSTHIQLNLSDGGLIALLKFLQFSFHGGTDLNPVLKLALDKQAEDDWAKADLLLVSDGRFPINKAIVKTIDDSKRTQKLRVFGVLTGNWQHAGMKSFCDDMLSIRC